jgi:hypothetical protein
VEIRFFEKCVPIDITGTSPLPETILFQLDYNKLNKYRAVLCVNSVGIKSRGIRCTHSDAIEFPLSSTIKSVRKGSCLVLVDGPPQWFVFYVTDIGS